MKKLQCLGAALGWLASCALLCAGCYTSFAVVHPVEDTVYVMESADWDDDDYDSGIYFYSSPYWEIGP